MDMGKQIYVVFSSTPYKIGKMIRTVTGEKYNHASIALDENLTQMYSFARRYQKTPLYGGFVRETSARYCRKGKRASMKIYKLDVEDARYEALKQKLEDMYQNKEDYLYNHLSALAVFLHKSIQPKNAYTCVEFCVAVLHDLGLPVNPGTYYSIGDLMTVLEPNLHYTGPIPHACCKDAEYRAKKPLPHPVLSSAKSIAVLLPRLKKS